MDFKVMPLGGASEVGANSFYVYNERFGIILDCGMDTKGDVLFRKPIYEKIKNKIDAILISHAHFDHIGSLPIALSMFPKTKIFMTEDTLNMTKISLKDSQRVMERENANIYYQDYYTDKKIADLEKNIITVNYCKRTVIKKDENIEISCEFYNAGHIRGSAMIMIYIYYKNTMSSVLYTGDINLVDTLCEKAVDIEQLPHNPHLLICESTYGNLGTKPYNRKEENEKLAKLINDAHNNNGCVLIPSFALGRTQEIVATLNYLLTEKKIDEKTTINIVGLSEKYSEFYPEMSNYDWHTLSSIREVKVNRNSGKKSIFIATNGMMKEGSHSHKIAKYLIEDEKSVIIFPGYLDSKSEGYKLLNQKIYQVNNEQFDVKCKVDKVQFSAHASRKDLENLLLEIKPQSSIYIHGDKPAVDNMQKFSEKNNIVSSAPLFNGEETIIVQNNSDIKLIQTGKTNAVIILVGTSVITNYLRDKKDNSYTEEQLLDYLNKKDSAETNTIKKLLKDKKISKDDVFYFIATDTDKGKTASTVLMQYLQDNFDVNYAETKFVRHLTDNAEEIQSKGITNFIDVVTNIISEHNDACIIATGGYKVEMSFATLIGLIYSKKVLYIHEDFNTIIETPLIPFVPDFSEYMVYKEDIDKLLKTSPNKASNNKYKSLPKTIKELLIQEKKTGIFKLSAMGKIISNFSSHIKNKENNIITDKKNIIEDLWEIDNESQNITLDNMKNTDFAKKIKTILQNPYVKHIEFKEVKETDEQSMIFEKKLVFKSQLNGILKYTLYFNGKKQNIEISVMPSFESCVKVHIPNEIFIVEQKEYDIDR